MASNRNVESTGEAVNLPVYPRPLATHADVVSDPNIFLDTLKKFSHAMGTKFIVPVMDGKSLNLHSLYVEVTKRGSYAKVTGAKIWRFVTYEFGFSPKATNASFTLRHHYARLLYHYEQVYFFRLSDGSDGKSLKINFSSDGEPSNINSSGNDDESHILPGNDEGLIPKGNEERLTLNSVLESIFNCDGLDSVLINSSVGEASNSIGEPSKNSTVEPSKNSIGEASNDSIGEPTKSIGEASNSIGQPSKNSIGETSNNSIGEPTKSIGEASNSIGEPLKSIGEASHNSIGEASHNSIGEPSNIKPSGNSDERIMFKIFFESKSDFSYIASIEKDSELYQAILYHQKPTIANTQSPSIPLATVATATNSSLPPNLASTPSATMMVKPPMSVGSNIALTSCMMVEPPKEPTNVGSNIASSSYRMVEPLTNMASESTKTPSDRLTTPKRPISVTSLSPTTANMAELLTNMASRSTKTPSDNTTTREWPKRVSSLSPTTSRMVKVLMSLGSKTPSDNIITPEPPTSTNSLSSTTTRMAKMLMNVGSKTPSDNTITPEPDTSVGSLSPTTTRMAEVLMNLGSKTPSDNTITPEPPASVGSLSPTTTRMAEVLLNLGSKTPSDNTITPEPPASLSPTPTRMVEALMNLRSKSTKSPSVNTTTSERPAIGSCTLFPTTQVDVPNTSEHRIDALKYNGKRPRGDTDRPKNTRSGYNFFFQRKRPELISLYPNCTMPNITKKVGKAWASLPYEEKEVYNKKGRKDSERFKREMQSYEEKQ